MAHVQGIEVGWTLLTGAASALTAVAVREAYKDAKEVKRRGINGIAQIVAAGSVDIEIGRLLGQLLLFGLGVTALFQWPSPEVCRTTFGSTVTVVLFAFEILFLLKTLRAWKMRHDIWSLGEYRR